MKKQFILLAAIVFGAVCLPSPNGRANACDKMCTASYTTEKNTAAKETKINIEDEDSGNAMRMFPFSL